MNSPKPSWDRFLLTLGVMAAGILGFVFVGIWIVDPHDHLLASPAFKRAPINTNQRYSYPAIARDLRFDSAVFGTSTSRLLQPQTLDAHLGGNFANLAMNSATAYEQSRLFELFVRHRHKVRGVLLGLDSIWCDVAERYEKYTFRAFPEWLYDDNRLNDFLHLLDGNTLEQAGRQIEYFIGRRKPRYGFDGFENFLEARNTYNRERALLNLYGEKGPRPRWSGPSRPEAPVDVMPTWTYPTHQLLDAMLERLPDETLKVLVFVPYHHFSQPSPNTQAALRWQECKGRVTRIASRHANSHVLDFMIGSAITHDDTSYWDPLHYSLPVGDRIVSLIAQGVRERRSQIDLFNYLRERATPAPAGMFEDY